MDSHGHSSQRITTNHNETFKALLSAANMLVQHLRTAPQLSLFVWPPWQLVGEVRHDEIT